MKPLKYSVLFLTLLILIIGCKKKDSGPANYFSFKGKTYGITQAIIDKNITDTLQGVHVDQYGFLSVSGTDSAILFIAIADLPANPLTGNFSSVDMNSTAARRIVSVSAVCGSLIILPDQSTYLSGLGGNMDVAVSGTTYTLNMNAISVGVYSGNIGGGTQYTEAGTVSGKYSGTPEAATITAYNGKQNPNLNTFIEKYKKLLNY